MLTRQCTPLLHGRQANKLPTRRLNPAVDGREQHTVVCRFGRRQLGFNFTKTDSMHANVLTSELFYSLSVCHSLAGLTIERRNRIYWGRVDVNPEIPQTSGS